MDQFMNDFLDGVYLEDPLTDSSRKNKTKGRRESDSGDISPPPTSLRRNKTAGDAEPMKRRVCRTKSNDSSMRNREPRRTPRRTKSGMESKRNKVERTSSKNMDPAEVLRMLEMYADRDDGMGALMLRRMKELEMEEPAPAKSGIKIPSAVVVKHKSSVAA